MGIKETAMMMFVMGAVCQESLYHPYEQPHGCTCRKIRKVGGRNLTTPRSVIKSKRRNQKQGRRKSR